MREIHKTGDYPQGTPLRKPKVVWKFRPGTGVSDPVVVDGVVYCGDDAGTVHALSARDGALRWQYAHGRRVFHAPIVDADRVYFTSLRGITALDRNTGARRWEHPIPLGAGAPLKVGQAVYVGGDNGIVYALDAATGTVKWERDIVDDNLVDPLGFPGARARMEGGAARPSGCASDGKALFQSLFDQSRVVAIECETGDERWDFQTRGWIFGHPTVADEFVLIGSQDKHLYCVDRQKGLLLWKTPTEARIESGAAVRGNVVFVGSCDGNLYRLDLKTGRIVWVFRTTPELPQKTAIYSSPLLIGDTVCFAAGEGQVYAVGIEDGKLRWKLRVSDQSETYSSPATDGRRLFVSTRTSSGKGEHAIVAIDEEDGP